MGESYMQTATNTSTHKLLAFYCAYMLLLLLLFPDVNVIVAILGICFSVVHNVVCLVVFNITDYSFLERSTAIG